MKKTKRWKLEDCYYGSKTKFDRNFVNNYEGSRLQMHRVRDRRNRRMSHEWIRSKYTEGLLQKYLNKPIEALEQAFIARTKVFKNPESFQDSYKYIIYGLCSTRHWCSNIEHFRYKIENGILVKNKEYKRYRSSKASFKPYQLKYNEKHVINPGKVRNNPVTCYNNPAIIGNDKPIYLGKLFALCADGLYFVDVYHYYRHFDAYDLRNPKIASKKEYYEREWIPVKIGITSLNYYVDERNYRYERLTKYLESPSITEEEKIRVQRELKWTRQIIRNDYGLGRWLYPVCKRTDIKQSH